jgi:hypothetical protein
MIFDVAIASWFLAGAPSFFKGPFRHARAASVRISASHPDSDVAGARDG